MSKVLIKLLVDRSGSMANCKVSAETGIQEFIEERRKDTSVKQEVSLDDFDTEYRTVYGFTDIANAPKYTLEPRGMTALHDSIMKAGRSLESHKPEKVKNKRFLVIMTDGLENSSREFSEKDVKEFIEKKQSEGWTVIYLGANQDAIRVGVSLGVPEGHSMTYDTSHSGSALKGTSFLMRSVVKHGNYEFTDEDRKRSLGK